MANLLFFLLINKSYIHTFFGTETSGKYTVKLFQTSSLHSAKFRVVFTKRASYTKAIGEDIKRWVKLNIEQWREEKEEWFDVKVIPDEFLPHEVFQAEGGIGRMRSGIGLLGRRSSISHT